MSKYGFIRDLGDQRDHVFSMLAVQLPDKIDLRSECPAIYDQGQIGSCTANAVCAAVEFDQMKQGIPHFMPSRLFLYYNTRAMEGTSMADAGASLRDTCKSVNNLGVCIESDWPYDETKLTDRPSLQSYDDAKLTRSLTYQRIYQKFPSQMRACLANGFPFVFGITVYESFESPNTTQTGKVFMPAADEAVLGGHALLCVGYDDTSQLFIFRNSWGDSWGDKGYGYIPYAYLEESNLASDFWCISVVS